MSMGRDLQDAAERAAKEGDLRANFRFNVGDPTSAARGSGARANADKLEWHQLPMFTLRGVIRVLMYGARKYAKGNWAKGMRWSIPYDCAMRHMDAWQRGEENDPESGLPHLDHALTNLIFLSAYRDLFPEGDDRFKEFAPGGVKAEAPTTGAIVGPGILEAHRMSLTGTLVTQPGVNLDPRPDPALAQKKRVITQVRGVGEGWLYTIYDDGTWTREDILP